MYPGYIYVLQNRAFGSYVVKIGLTTREPSIRAREIYSGSTGVPMPFDIAVAYSVADCKLAEKLTHRRLTAYRLNRRREFFLLSPSVAATTAYETCAHVNAILGLGAPKPYVFPTVEVRMQSDTVADVLEPETDETFTSLVDPYSLKESPIGTSTLTEEQIDRARTVSRILAKLNPVAHHRWIDDFTRDLHPEREIRIWEHIAKAYLSVDGIELAPPALQAEAFSLLLSRSMRPTEKVLEEMPLKNFTRRGAKRLLDAYELRAKPILVSGGTNAIRRFGSKAG
jgi:hypothetical protein